MKKVVGRAVNVLGVYLFVAPTDVELFFYGVGMLVQGQNQAIGYQNPYKHE